MNWKQIFSKMFSKPETWVGLMTFQVVMWGLYFILHPTDTPTVFAIGLLAIPCGWTAHIVYALWKSGR